MQPPVGNQHAEPDQDNMQKDGKIPAENAGYVELDGAQKDADCSIVSVPGGVSSAGGCCNNWTDPGGASNFSCGSCLFLTQGQQDQMQPEPENYGTDEAASPLEY